MNILHTYIETILPYLISFIEIIGIAIVFGSAIYSFILYLINPLNKTKRDIHEKLAEGLAMGLEFKMAAEILRTVLIQSLDELYMLGAVILLRALLSLLIHYEIRPHTPKKSPAADKNKNDKKDVDNQE